MIIECDPGEHEQICIHLKGFGDKVSVDGQGCPIMIDTLDGRVRLMVWADINYEDPTDILCLEGARESARRPEGGGVRS